MKLHFNIPSGVKLHFEMELEFSRIQFRNGNLLASWKHLERAHILGQAWPIQHTIAHWRMMRFALKMKNGKEIIGQIPRLLVGGVKSFVGEIPVGNSGGANVPALMPMEIPDDLSEVLKKYNS